MIHEIVGAEKLEERGLEKTIEWGRKGDSVGESLGEKGATLKEKFKWEGEKRFISNKVFI